jgi:hypothetical protein
MRPHAAEAIAGLVEFMRQREDCHLAMSAMIALLDRGYGRPPQALQVGGNEPMVVKYDIRWADAGTNSFPEDEPATIAGCCPRVVRLLRTASGHGRVLSSPTARPWLRGASQFHGCGYCRGLRIS